MKRYAVFAGTVSGTSGGAYDFLVDFSSLKSALDYRSQFLSLERKKQYWCHVWDTQDFKIIPNQPDEYGKVMGDTFN